MEASSDSADPCLFKSTFPGYDGVIISRSNFHVEIYIENYFKNVFYLIRKAETCVNILTWQCKFRFVQIIIPGVDGAKTEGCQFFFYIEIHVYREKNANFSSQKEIDQKVETSVKQSYSNVDSC